MPGKAKVIRDMLAQVREARLLDAERQGLDMSREARIRRAESGGFDTGAALYHGTTESFPGFDPNAFSRASSFGPGAYVSVDPEDAARWARSKEGASVMPMYGRMDRVLRMEPLSEEAADKLSRYLGRRINAGDSPPYISLERRGGSVSEGAAAAGFSGVEHAGPSGKTHIVFSDPSALRSVHAAFDPAKRDSSNLLASHGAGVAAGVGAAGIAAPEDAMSDVRRKRQSRELNMLRSVNAESPQQTALELYRQGYSQAAITPEEIPALGAAADATRQFNVGGYHPFEGVADVMDYLAQRGRDPRYSELFKRAGWAVLDVLP